MFLRVGVCHVNTIGTGVHTRSGTACINKRRAIQSFRFNLCTSCCVKYKLTLFAEPMSLPVTLTTACHRPGRKRIHFLLLLTTICTLCTPMIPASPMSLWLPCGLHGFAVPNTVTVTEPNNGTVDDDD